MTVDRFPTPAHAIANAALMLRAPLATEVRLGARAQEPLFIARALREWTVSEVVVERQATMASGPVDWRRDVTAEAARRMHLTP